MSRKNTKNSVKQPELDLEKWKPEVDGKFHFIFGKFASLEADVQNVRQVNGEIKNQNHNLENELQIVEEINGEIKGENEKLMKKLELITTNINRCEYENKLFSTLEINFDRKSRFVVFFFHN